NLMLFLYLVPRTDNGPSFRRIMELRGDYGPPTRSADAEFPQGGADARLRLVLPRERFHYRRIPRLARRYVRPHRNSPRPHRGVSICLVATPRRGLASESHFQLVRRGRRGCSAVEFVGPRAKDVP